MAFISSPIQTYSMNGEDFDPEKKTLLIENEDEYDGSDSSWTSLHTWTVMFIRISIDVTFKNFLFFYMNYADGLGITAMQFSYIVIASEVGCICALFFGGLNAKYLKSDINIMFTYLLINGIACILFILPAYIMTTNTLYIIVWCSVCRFIIGLCYSFIYTSSIHFATLYVKNRNKVASIALLHYSWPLSTLLNIAIGYIIQYFGWYNVWILVGLLLIIIAIISRFIFYWKPIVNDTSNTEYSHDDIIEETNIFDGLYVILKDWKCVLIIFVSFLMTFRSRTIYTVTASLWMEKIYGLSVSITGWTSLCIVFGEVIGLAFIQYISYRMKLWKITLICLLNQLIIGSLPLFVLSLLYGDTIGGYFQVAMFIIVLLAIGHESYYVTQQTNCIKFSPLPRYTTILLLAERMMQEIGAIVALYVTAKLWMTQENDFILLFSTIWLCTSFLMLIIMFIYKK